MLELLFSFKRVYLTGQRHLIAALRAYGLTPARLDVMRMVLEGIRTQRDLRRALGIARSTISRMLTSMEKRGLIVRTSRAPQRATKRVAIAAGVEQRIREALDLLRPAVAAALATVLHLGPHAACRFYNQATELEYVLLSARIDWADRSTHKKSPLLRLFDP
ncbi:MAG: MarR family transcriptional regulator [Polyangiaceae bacterium]